MMVEQALSFPWAEGPAGVVRYAGSISIAPRDLLLFAAVRRAAPEGRYRRALEDAEEVLWALNAGLWDAGRLLRALALLAEQNPHPHYLAGLRAAWGVIEPWLNP